MRGIKTLNEKCNFTFYGSKYNFSQLQGKDSESKYQSMSVWMPISPIESVMNELCLFKPLGANHSRYGTLWSLAQLCKINCQGVRKPICLSCFGVWAICWLRIAKDSNANRRIPLFSFLTGNDPCKERE